jgi:hypothetical protein
VGNCARGRTRRARTDCAATGRNRASGATGIPDPALLLLFTNQLQHLVGDLLGLLELARLHRWAEPLHQLGNWGDVLAGALHLLRALLDALDLGDELRWGSERSALDLRALARLVELLDGASTALAWRLRTNAFIESTMSS